MNGAKSARLARSSEKTKHARGDAVVVRGPDTHEIGRGLVAYDAEDAEKIKGRSSPDVMAILGLSGRAEMIHRDDLVIGPAGTVPVK